MFADDNPFLAVYARSIGIAPSGKVSLVLRNGRKLEGTTARLSSIHYGRECIEKLPADPTQDSLSKIFQQTDEDESEEPSLFPHVETGLRLFPVDRQIPPPRYRRFPQAVYWNGQAAIFLQVDCRIPEGAPENFDIEYTYVASEEGQQPIQGSLVLHIVQGSRYCQGTQFGFRLDPSDAHHMVYVDLYANQQIVARAKLYVLP